MIKKKCINCSSKYISKFFSSKDFVTKDKYDFYTCNNCDIKFINPLPKLKRLSSIYEFENDDLESNANKLLFMFWKNKLFKNIFNFFGDKVNLERVSTISKLQNKRKNKVLLDVGCGTGLFLKHMSQNGWKVYGQEVSKISIKEAKARFSKNKKINITNKFIENYKIPKNVKVVTMWHVFEHIVNFKKVVKHLSKSLQKKDYLVLETPNSNALSMNLFGKLSPMTLVPEHITFWSEKGFDQILGKNNFEILEISYPMTFPFTASSAAYKYFIHKFNNNILALFFTLTFMPFSLIIYLFKPKMNESIRVIAIKK